VNPHFFSVDNLTSLVEKAGVNHRFSKAKQIPKKISTGMWGNPLYEQALSPTISPTVEPLLNE